MAKTTQTKSRTTRTKKKRPTTNKRTGAHQAQDSVNLLYVAHQVHTLANVLFHQMALATQAQTHQPAATFGFGATPWHAAPWRTAAGTPQGVSQPLLYWYP